MRYRAKFHIFLLVFLCLTPLSAFTAYYGAEVSIPSVSRVDLHSTSGRVISIGDAQFSLETSARQKSNTLQFLIDEDTKVEGQLIVGSYVNVDYRQDGDKLVAHRVTIRPDSSISHH
jgi:Domain of unknown function (DUF5666)